MTERHVVVVGAGAGGLSAAIDLARQGLRVTLLERAAQPGGKLRQLQAGGRGIDSGPTVFTMRWVFDSLFEAAGETLEAHLQLEPLDILARHAWATGARLDLHADLPRSAAVHYTHLTPSTTLRRQTVCVRVQVTKKRYHTKTDILV